MATKGSKSAAVKVVKKIKKDLAAIKKPLSKAAKKIAKDISAVKKPISKVAKKIAKDLSVAKKPVKAAKKVVKKKVVAVKKPVAKVSKPAKKIVKAAKKPVKAVAKKKPAVKSVKKPVKAAAKKVAPKVKKNVKQSSKAKAVKKKVVKKTAGAVKSKKTAKKTKAVKKNKPAKEERRGGVAKAVKKKLVKAVSKVQPKKTASKAVIKKVGAVSKAVEGAVAKNKLGNSFPFRSVSEPTSVKTRRNSDPMMPTLPPRAATLLMNGTILPYKEKVGEEYMNNEQQMHFRTLLKAWKDQLMHDMVTTVHHMQDEAANFPDPNDRATQEEEFSLELRTRDRELKLVKKIEEAIHKLDNHEYGYCDTCGIKIGIRRLEARPTATQCIDCKTLDEIREKQLMG